MAEGEAVNTRDTPAVDVLERGEIFFFYRPKVDTENPRDIGDVQKMYLVLRPESSEGKEEGKQSSKSGKEGKFAGSERKERGAEVEDDSARNDSSPERGAQAVKKGEEEKHDTDRRAHRKQGDSSKGKEGGSGSEKVNIEKRTLLRFIVIGRKSLPDPSKRTRPYWGFVELVTTNVDDVKKSLGPEEYETSTRGARHQPAARPMGEGVYRILRHKSGRQVHTHLVYRLQLPGADKQHEPQEAMNIEEEGSFIIQIKNPEQPAAPHIGLGGKRRATYPASLQGHFGSYRFISADPPDLLNYEGGEFILIAASDDIEGELGYELKVENEGDKTTCSDLLQQLLGDEGKKYQLNVKPLIEGAWA